MAINLVKGQKINLEKENGEKLSQICLGLNWGAIEKKSLFGKSKESVDLDGSCAIFNEKKDLLEVIYFGNLKSKNDSILHSGDDLSGDDGEDDGIDNEIIKVDLDQVGSEADQIVFILNSFQGHDFSTIPFARIRIFEGDFKKVENVVAHYDVAQSSKFKGFVSMIMGKLYKRGGEWKFSAIGEPTSDTKLKDSLKTVKERYL